MAHLYANDVYLFIVVLYVLYMHIKFEFKF